MPCSYTHCGSPWPLPPQFLTCDQAVLASCPGTCRAHCLSQVRLHLLASFLGSSSGRLSRMPSLPCHHGLIPAQPHIGPGPPGCDTHKHTHAAWAARFSSVKFIVG